MRSFNTFLSAIFIFFFALVDQVEYSRSWAECILTLSPLAVWVALNVCSSVEVYEFSLSIMSEVSGTQKMGDGGAQLHVTFMGQHRDY